MTESYGLYTGGGGCGGGLFRRPQCLKIFCITDSGQIPPSGDNSDIGQLFVPSRSDAFVKGKKTIKTKLSGSSKKLYSIFNIITIFNVPILKVTYDGL